MGCSASSSQVSRVSNYDPSPEQGTETNMHSAAVGSRSNKDDSQILFSFSVELEEGSAMFGKLMWSQGAYLFGLRVSADASIRLIISNFRSESYTCVKLYDDILREMEEANIKYDEYLAAISSAIAKNSFRVKDTSKGFRLLFPVRIQVSERFRSKKAFIPFSCERKVNEMESSAISVEFATLLFTANQILSKRCSDSGSSLQVSSKLHVPLRDIRTLPDDSIPPIAPHVVSSQLGSSVGRLSNCCIDSSSLNMFVDAPDLLRKPSPQRIKKSPDPPPPDWVLPSITDTIDTSSRERSSSLNTCSQVNNTHKRQVSLSLSRPDGSLESIDPAQRSTNTCPDPSLYDSPGLSASSSKLQNPDFAINNEQNVGSDEKDSSLPHNRQKDVENKKHAKKALRNSTLPIMTELLIDRGRQTILELADIYKFSDEDRNLLTEAMSTMVSRNGFTPGLMHAKALPSVLAQKSHSIAGSAPATMCPDSNCDHTSCAPKSSSLLRIGSDGTFISQSQKDLVRFISENYLPAERSASFRDVKFSDSSVDESISPRQEESETSSEHRRSILRRGKRALQRAHCTIRFIRFLKDLNLREVQRLKVDVDILKRVEERISRWDFNAFEVSQITGDRPLYYTAVALLHRFQIQQRFPDILFTRLLAYIDRLESLYRDNSYHNKEHAADVTQTFAFLVVKANILQYMTDIDILASILACCAHDVGHPGVNNAFLVRTMDNLSIRFNDMSVLEQYHCSTGFSLIVDHVELNFLENWSLEDRKAFREVFVKNILATDMQEHFRLLGSFKNQLVEMNFSLENRPFLLSFLQMVIKASDVSNPSKPLHVYNMWTEHVMSEFFQQGDQERQRAFQISQFMDREKPTIRQCQLGFINFIVNPLFEAVSSVCPSLSLMTQFISYNRSCWEACDEDASSAAHAETRPAFLDDIVLNDVLFRDLSDLNDETDTIENSDSSKDLMST